MNRVPSSHAPQGERGIVLVSAVLTLVLTAILAATFMATATGERTLSSNVHIARGALYAADAGVRTMQQVLANQAQGRLDSLLLVWPGTGPIISQPTTFFPAGSIVSNATTPNFTTSATIAFTDSDLTDTSQVYNYLYTATSTGKRGLFGTRQVRSQGLLRVSASRGSFADYLIFTNTHLTPGGGAIWFSSSASFDGRVHTNGEFRFAYTPSFQDLASSVNTKAWYYNYGSPKELSANNNGTIDQPSFYGGFVRGAANVALPPNSFGQQNAALGLSPASTTSPDNATVNGQLGTGAGSSTPPNGIYVVNTGGVCTGGIYVQGNLDRCLASVDSMGRQVYQFTQGATVRTVTLDPTNNLTTVKTGATTVNYTGQPRPIIYTKGQISDLRGPDRSGGFPPPALASDNQLLIAATNDIIVQRDVTYEDYNGGRNVLGLYSSAGSVRVGSGMPNDGYLDAYVMATGTSGSFTVDNYDSGSPRGTFHLRGGMVTSYYGAFYTFNSSGVQVTGFGRDYHYDRRGIVPPYYPTTNRFSADEPSGRTLVWKEI